METLSAGVFFHTSSEDVIKELAKEDNVYLDWDELNDDSQIIETNFLKLLSKNFESVRDEGHDGDNVLYISVTVNAESIPDIFYKKMQDDANYDARNDALLISYYNEKIDDYASELLRGTKSKNSYLLLADAGFSVMIENPNELYLDELN